MVLNRNSDRRRRLLVDGAVPVGESEASAGDRSRDERPTDTPGARPYAIGACRRHQLKTTDLIPKRRLAYGLSVAWIVLVVAGLNLLSCYAPDWQPVIGDAGVSMLTLWGPGTLSNWFAATGFLLAAGISWQILVLRRHRNDDYEGTYRVWGWLTVLWLVASVGCSLDLAGPVLHAVASITSVSMTDPEWLPLAMAGTLVSLLALRVLLEVRRSYGTVAWLTVGWLAIAAGMLVPSMSTSFGFEDRISGDLARGNAMLVLAGSLVLGTLTYARFVFLRANGLIQDAVVRDHAAGATVAKRKVKSSKSAKSKAAKTTSTKTGSAKSKSAKSETGRATAAQSNSTVSAPADSQSAAGSKVTERPTSRKSKSKSKSKASKARPTPLDDSTDTGKVASAPAATSSPATPQPAAERAPSKSAKSPNRGGETQSGASPAADSGNSKGTTASPPRSINADASERLKQLAAASRAKQAARQSTAEGAESAEADGADDSPSTVKMSKAEKRRERKRKRKTKRAA